MRRERERKSKKEKRERERERTEIKSTKKYSFIQFTHHPIYMR